MLRVIQTQLLLLVCTLLLSIMSSKRPRDLLPGSELGIVSIHDADVPIDPATTSIEPPLKRARGRPLGSKNKKKVTEGTASDGTQTGELSDHNLLFDL